jgi:tRNA(Ile)-lysidine synthase
LSRIFEDVLHAKAGAEPCVSWEDVQIRRYRDILFLTAPLPEPAPVESEIFWKPEDDCMLNVGRLSARRGKGNGIKLEKYPGRGFIVKFRRGSDVIKKNGHHHKLRKLFQEKGVPSCYRDYIPLIYIDDRLVEISGLHIDDDFLALPDEDALQIRWSGAAQVYALSDD